jgi:ribosomal protein L40E
MGIGAERSSSGTQRCDSCGGLNPPRAEWCGQCLTRFAMWDPAPDSGEPVEPYESPRMPPSTQFDPLTAPELPGSPAANPTETPPSRSLRPVGGGAFRVTGSEVLWSCSTCGGENSLAARTCQTCGTSFATVVSTREPARAGGDPNTAALLSLFLPGAGHAYLGHMGQAIARAVMSMWVVGVTLIAMFSGGGRTSMLLSVCYGISAAGLWLAAAHDAYREAKDQSSLVLLSGRRFLYVTLGLVGVLFVVMTFGAMGARGAIGG